MSTTRWDLHARGSRFITERLSALRGLAAFIPKTYPLSRSVLVRIEALVLALVALTLTLILAHLHALPGLHHAGRVAMRTHPGLLLAMVLPLSQEVLGPAFRAGLVKALTESFTIERLTVTPMRRRPASRHVFSCEFVIGDQLTGKQRSIELIGKCDALRATGKAAREFGAMRLLWDAGFSRDESFMIPRPVQYFPDFQLILQGRARGSKLRHYAGKGTDISLGYARMAGLWLAKLHNLKVMTPQVCTYTHEIAALRTFVGAITAAQPKLECELQHRGALLERNFTQFQSVPSTMVHGDFHPDHIFVSKDSVTVIDFERSSTGDPALDVGSFIAHMRTTARCLGRALATANREIDAFLESYLSAVSATQSVVILPRVASYVTLSNLEALYYVASVLRVGDPNRLEIYLNCMRQAELPALESSFPPLALCGASRPVQQLSEEII
jgi:aminoglycoside phosphotransferase (APT) family kinase protein